MGAKTELIKIFDDLPEDKKKQALKIIRNISINHNNQPDVSTKQGNGLKKLLRSIPNVGSDEDFERGNNNFVKKHREFQEQMNVEKIYDEIKKIRDETDYQKEAKRSRQFRDKGRMPPFGHRK